jgi:hypothetical protein
MGCFFTLKENSLLRNVKKGLGFGLVVWNDLGSGKWILNLEYGMFWSLYVTGSLKTVANELAKCNVDLY